ncbi:MAG: helix-turn-helix transcriptional regulator [Nitrospira sp.]|jgi:transcriptional regulator with XRE-family HTH domain|nr:helix-turn-helix transcriptional regulator [Nitrospira sp.]
MKLKEPKELNRIRVFRQELGLSQKALAANIGTSQQQIQRIEAGTQSVRHDLAIKISAALGAPVATLFPAVSEAAHTITFSKASPARVPVQVSRRMRTELADAADVEGLAHRLDAPAILPQLIKKLAICTLVGLEEIHIGSEDGKHGSVWDGVLRVSQGHVFVSPGVSGWEMGTQEQVEEKADADYAARVNEPGVVQPAHSTFVFVTPRRWANKEAWALSKRQEGLWKDVRVLDADDLAAWLEACPAVHIWFSTLMGRHPSGVMDIHSFWHTWSGATCPAISPELVLAGRWESVVPVHEFLLAQPSVLELQADTREEALAFFAAAVLRMGNPEEREAILARAVIVDDPVAWRQLAGWTTPLVLIPLVHDRHAVAAALANGHSIAVPFGGGERPSHGAIILPWLNREAASAILDATGVAPHRAGELAALAGRSLGVLRRALAVDASTVTPFWTESGSARILISALFAGQWNDRNPADQQVLSALAGTAYGEVTALLQRWAGDPDPPVRLAGDMRVWASLADGWCLLSRSISKQHLERLESVVLEVLGERDPVLTHSGALRKGLAETLAILGSWSEVCPIDDRANGQAWATRMLTKLLSQSEDWFLWTSLSPLFPCLAEAAPDVFLSALERALASPPTHLGTIVSDGDNAALHAPPSTGLLDALEGLAWSPDYFARTALMLATLAGKGPGGGLATGPLVLLRKVLRCGGSGTVANLDERLRVLDLIRTREPNVAWDLLDHCVPSSLDPTQPVVKPRWREWGAERNPTAISTEILRAAEEIAQRQLDDTGTAGSRWKALIDRLPEVPRSVGESLCGRLLSLDPGLFSEADKSLVWESVRQMVSSHRRDHRAAGALSPNVVDRLVGLQAKFEPRDPVIKRKWLFSAEPESSSKQSREDYAKALQEAQISSVDTLFAQGGLPAILSLADQVPYPEKVGAALGASQVPDASEVEILTQCLGSSNEARRQLGRHFLITRRAMKGYNWAVRLREGSVWHTWTPAQRADYFRCLPFPDKMTWDAVDREDDTTRRLYWSHIGPHGHGRLDGQFLERVVQKFLDYRQWESAIELLVLSSEGESSRVRSGLAVEVMSRLASSSPGELDWGRQGHRVVSLLKQMVRSGEISDVELARLEWTLRPFIRCDPRLSRVERVLAETPAFFVELLTCTYGPEPHAIQDATQAQQLRAQCGADLLSRWQQAPGLNVDGTVSIETLTPWVSRARELASSLGLLKAADYQIGRVLAHYPPGEDGAWPHEAVRNLMEKLASEEMEAGLSLGLSFHGNAGREKRSEWKVQADRLRESARRLREGWPRTSRLMAKIATSYEDRAWREDLAQEWGSPSWKL